MRIIRPMKKTLLSALVCASIFAPTAYANLMQTSIEFSNSLANAGFSTLRLTFTYDDNRALVSQSNGVYQDIFGPGSQGWSGQRNDYQFNTFSLTGLYSINTSSPQREATPITITDAIASLSVTSVSATRVVAGNVETRNGQYFDIALAYSVPVPANGLGNLSLRFYASVQDNFGNLALAPMQLISQADAQRLLLSTANFKPTNTGGNDCCEFISISAASPVNGNVPPVVPPVVPPGPGGTVPLPASVGLIGLGLLALRLNEKNAVRTKRLSD
jgi:opacity protein-like surface antigen